MLFPTDKDDRKQPASVVISNLIKISNQNLARCASTYHFEIDWEIKLFIKEIDAPNSVNNTPAPHPKHNLPLCSESSCLVVYV